MLSPKCASTYSRTRRIAPGDNPPCACGAGGSLEISIEPRRGRVGRVQFVGLLEAVIGGSGGVTSPGRLSLLPAISNRPEISVCSRRRSRSLYLSKIDHKLVRPGIPR